MLRQTHTSTATCPWSSLTKSSMLYWHQCLNVSASQSSSLQHVRKCPGDALTRTHALEFNYIPVAVGHTCEHFEVVDIEEVDSNVVIILVVLYRYRLYRARKQGGTGLPVPCRRTGVLTLLHHISSTH